MSKIKDLKAFETLDSSGNPALSITVYLEEGISESSTEPTNNFPSSYGVLDIKDNDPKRFEGHGLLQAISIAENLIKPRIVGIDTNNQKQIDKILLTLDSSNNKSKIGGNTMIAISTAIAKAEAKSNNQQLFEYLKKMVISDTVQIPVPIFTMIDGGKNANYNTDINEFLIVPASNKNLSESIELGSTIHKNIASLLIKENILPFTGEKGGFGPILSTNEDALSLIAQALESLNMRLGYDIYIGMDSNANTFYKNEHYKIKDHNIPMNRAELIKFYSGLCEKYHILYLEDPLADEDTEGWTEIFSALNRNVILAGDYFISTNPLRLQMALSKKTINGIVIKPSNIGTVTEALAVAMMAKAAGVKIIVSDNTNSTTDTFLADFAVAISADYVRFGAPSRGERVAKYNRLIEIEKKLQG